MSLRQSQAVVSRHDHTAVSVRTYIMGFTASALLTLAAFAVVWLHVHQALGSRPAIVALITALAIIQLWVQVTCFLHLGQDRRPRWKSIVFWFMLVVVFILVAGTIWIMNNLNYNMMHMPAPNTYMHNHEGL